MSDRSRTGLIVVAVSIAAALALAAFAGVFGNTTALDPRSREGGGSGTTIAAIDLDTAALATSVATTSTPPATTTTPSTTTATPPETTVQVVVGEPRGALPDGTPYHVLGEPPIRETVQAEDIAANQVHYESFLVAAGCGDDAVACSETNAVQVVPLRALDPDAPEWDEDRRVWVESDAPRPAADPAWIDPGPLVPRGGHDVHWTGSEMIVWGGAVGDRDPHLVDGAAFDPATGEWRMLAPAPFDREITTRSVWAGDRMIVVSDPVTLGYDPATDSWETLGDGAIPGRWPGLMAWDGSDVYMFNRLSVLRFDEAQGGWVDLGPPPFGSDSSPWEGALRLVDGDPVVIGNATGICEGRQLARLTDAGWEELPPVSLETAEYADCSFPNQTAVVGDTLLVWEDHHHPTKTLVDGEWRDGPTIPLTGTEGPQGPVSVGERVLVPQWGSAAIYDPASGFWSDIVDLPGWGQDTDMVWTGEEILMWGAACCYGGGGPFRIDAWRWRPPE